MIATKKISKGYTQKEMRRNTKKKNEAHMIEVSNGGNKGQKSISHTEKIEKWLK